MTIKHLSSRSVAFVIASAIPLSACGAGSADTSAPEDTTGTFPVTIEHGLGTTEIPSPPQRVVALSWTDVQIAHALDADIVAAVRNPDTPDGNWPATDLDEDILVLDSVTPEPELIASFDPDLILMTAPQPTFLDEYDRLSDVAPVVAYRDALLQDDGDELTTMIGEALGKSDEAAELIEESRAAIDAFRADIEGLDDVTAVFGQNYQGSTGVIIGDDTPVVAFLNRLGLQVPEDLAALADESEQLGTVQLSDERLGLLDTADVVFINAPEGEEAFLNPPIVQQLSVVVEDRLHFTGNEFASMLLTPNPATTELLLDRLREPLSAAADR